MSGSAEEQPLDDFTDEDWTIVAEMAEEYDDQLGDDLRAIYEGYHDGQEEGDE